MSKKTTYLLILILLVLVYMNNGIMEEEPLVDGDYQYLIEQDGTAKIIKYIGTALDVTIPSILGGVNVSILGYGCFDSSGITEVVIPEGVKVIEENAFAWCDLKSVNIPSSIESIGWLVFVLNPNLFEFSVDEGNKVYVAVDGVLYDKKTSMLHTYPMAKPDSQYMVLPSTKTLFADSFNSAENLKTVELPEGLTGIAIRAFYGCSGIESIVLPKSLSYVTGSSFQACNNLTDIQADNVVYGSIDGVLVDKRKAELVSYPAGRSAAEYTVPSSIKSIGASAFRNNAFIKSIILPQGLRSIDRFAFYGCSQLLDINIPFGVETVGMMSFGYCAKLQNVYIPPTVKTIESQDFTMEDVRAGLMLYVYQGSPAEAYAINEKLHFTILEMVNKIEILLSLDNVIGKSVQLDLNADSHMLDLDAVLTPESSYRGVVWSSSSDKVASVDLNGVVTGLKKGTATITATAADGSKVKASVKVNVTYLAKGIAITGSTELKAGKKTTLKVTVLPAETVDKKVTWSSSDNAVATVSAGGVVTAKKVIEPKIVTIAATAKDGSGVFAEFVITVMP